MASKRRPRKGLKVVDEIASPAAGSAAPDPTDPPKAEEVDKTLGGDLEPDDAASATPPAEPAPAPADAAPPKGSDGAPASWVQAEVPAGAERTQSFPSDADRREPDTVIKQPGLAEPPVADAAPPVADAPPPAEPPADAAASAASTPNVEPPVAATEPPPVDAAPPEEPPAADTAPPAEPPADAAAPEEDAPTVKVDAFALDTGTGRIEPTTPPAADTAPPVASAASTPNVEPPANALRPPRRKAPSPAKPSSMSFADLWWVALFGAFAALLLVLFGVWVWLDTERGSRAPAAPVASAPPAEPAPAAPVENPRLLIDYQLVEGQADSRGELMRSLRDPNGSAVRCRLLDRDTSGEWRGVRDSCVEAHPRPNAGVAQN